MRTTLVLFALLACVFAQDFSCKIDYQTKIMRNGIVQGTFKMTSGAPARYKVTLPPKIVGGQTLREEYNELVQFNKDNGLNGGAALPYTDQIVFRTGTSCACETGYFDHSIPLMHPYDANTQSLLESFYTKGAAKNGCDVYTIKATPDSSKFPALKLNLIDTPLTEVHINPNTKFPCYAAWDDGRTFTFSDCKKETFTKTVDFKEPSGCKCGKPLDIVFVLDRSGSISLTEFYDQKGFVIDFANQFEFDPLKANLAIINFQSTAWVHLNLKDGTTDANVNASVQALGCPRSCDQNNGGSCTGSPQACCCCCGTCISCGQRMGADQFPTGRKFAFKLLIVITDGFANTASPGQTCSGAAGCNNDLAAATAYVKSKVTDVSQLAIYAVGVGEDRDVSAEQLLIVADGKKDHVLRRNSFAELASVNVELISRSCDQNLFPCGGCCGFCLCGKCMPPDTCANTSLCNSGNLPSGQVCCTTTPTSCAAAAAADKCSTYVCSEATGGCVKNTTTDCGSAQNTTCFDRECVPATGLCKTSPTGKCPGETECVNASGCNDDNVCTIDNCTGESCVWAPLNCSAQTPPVVADECGTVKCDPILGCMYIPMNVSEVCNDNNACTEDTCDKKVGCVNTPWSVEKIAKDCDDQDFCTDELCDSGRGCISVPKLCNLTGNTSCKLAICNKTDGNCTFELVECGTVLPVGVIAGTIGAAALVGIIIAAIICAAGAAGGGAYAYVQAQGNGALAETKSNPLYKGDGNQGTNPLYRG